MQPGISSRSSFDMMNEEGRAYRGEPALQGLVEKFEAMVEHGEQAFFDVDELEGLIEHYLEQKSKAQQKDLISPQKEQGDPEKQLSICR